MNPDWEIRYIEYSTSQVVNFSTTNDNILKSIMSNSIYCKDTMCVITEHYRRAYLSLHRDELIVYCDLDCFPIAPLDNFIAESNERSDKWLSWYCTNKHEVKNIGNNAALIDQRKHLFKDDNWCVCNSRLIMFNQFLQIHKNSTTDETLTAHQGMFMNFCDIPLYEQRNNDFHDMKIQSGDNFCLPQFTPIEHYYSLEREHLNLNATADLRY